MSSGLVVELHTRLGDVCDSPTAAAISAHALDPGQRWWRQCAAAPASNASVRQEQQLDCHDAVVCPCRTVSSKLLAWLAADPAHVATPKGGNHWIADTYGGLQQLFAQLRRVRGSLRRQVVDADVADTKSKADAAQTIRIARRANNPHAQSPAAYKGSSRQHSSRRQVSFSAPAEAYLQSLLGSAHGGDYTATEHGQHLAPDLCANESSKHICEPTAPAQTLNRQQKEESTYARLGEGEMQQNRLRSASLCERAAISPP